MTPESLQNAINHSILPSEERGAVEAAHDHRLVQEQTKEYIEKEQRDRWLKHAHTMQFIAHLDIITMHKTTQVLNMSADPSIDDKALRIAAIEARTLLAAKIFAQTGQYSNPQPPTK